MKQKPRTLNKIVRTGRKLIRALPVIPPYDAGGKIIIVRSQAIMVADFSIQYSKTNRTKWLKAQISGTSLMGDGNLKTFFLRADGGELDTIRLATQAEWDAIKACHEEYKARTDVIFGDAKK